MYKVILYNIYHQVMKDGRMAYNRVIEKVIQKEQSLLLISLTLLLLLEKLETKIKPNNPAFT